MQLPGWVNRQRDRQAGRLAAVETEEEEEEEAALQLLASYQRGHTEEATVVSAVNLCNCLDKCNCIHPHSYTYIHAVHTYANAYSLLHSELKLLALQIPRETTKSCRGLAG